jgi:hypothetical protein
MVHLFLPLMLIVTAVGASQESQTAKPNVAQHEQAISQLAERIQNARRVALSGQAPFSITPSLRADSPNEKRPQCATTDEVAKVKTIISTCSAAGKCCGVNLPGANQVALCVVAGCCLRLLLNPAKNATDFIGVGERWSASGSSTPTGSRKYGVCYGFNKQSSQCDLSCALAFNSNLDQIDCSRDGITVPTENNDFAPTGTCSAPYQGADKQDGPKPSKNIPIIAGSVGGVVFLAIVAALFCFCMARLRKKRNAARNQESGEAVKPTAVVPDKAQDPNKLPREVSVLAVDQPSLSPSQSDVSPHPQSPPFMDGPFIPSPAYVVPNVEVQQPTTPPPPPMSPPPPPPGPYMPEVVYPGPYGFTSPVPDGAYGAHLPNPGEPLGPPASQLPTGPYQSPEQQRNLQH